MDGIQRSSQKELLDFLPKKYIIDPLTYLGLNKIAAVKKSNQNIGV